MIKNMRQYEDLPEWKKITFGGCLDLWADKYTDNVAVMDEEKSLSYIELRNRARELAYAFLEIGVKRKDRVLVQLPNRVSFVEVLFALSYVGAIPILALPAQRKRELQSIIEISEPVAYITAERYLGYNYLEMAHALKEENTCLDTIIIDGDEGGDYILSGLYGKPQIFQEVNPYEPALLLLSGGTTGLPKLIPRTHTDYLYNAQRAALLCELNESSIYLAALSIAHNFPLSCPGLLGTLSVGGRVILASNSSPDEIFEKIEKNKVTITALVPSIVNLCLEMMDIFLPNLSSLRILQVGGAMLDEGVAMKIVKKWPCKLMQVYGTAEGLICFTDLNDSINTITKCQGRPISYADEIRIVDTQGNTLKRGEIGELICRGPYTITEYFKSLEANEICFTEDGFYRTGDSAMLTEEGNIQIKGRVRDQINRAGEKINPSEIEHYLCECDYISDAAVVGVPDELLGSRICAFIIAQEGANVSRERIISEFAKKEIPFNKYPDQIVRVKSFPMTNFNKVDKNQLYEMAFCNY